MKDLTGLLVCGLFCFTGQRAFWIREHIGLIDRGTPQFSTHPQMHPAGWMNWVTTICQVKWMSGKLFKKYWIVLQKHSYVVKYKMTCYVKYGRVSRKNKHLTILKSRIQHRWLRKFRIQRLSTRWYSWSPYDNSLVLVDTRCHISKYSYLLLEQRDGRAKRLKCFNGRDLKIYTFCMCLFKYTF